MAFDSLTGGILLGTIIFFISIPLCIRIFKSKKRPAIPPNVVCLFQVGRGSRSPSLSPFPLKLETYLRLAKIPYMNDHSGQMSSKGKTPWMMYNGQAVADSQFCIEFLKQNLHVDTDKHLSKQEQAVARALRELTEENLYCVKIMKKIQEHDKNLVFLPECIINVFSGIKPFSSLYFAACILSVLGEWTMCYETFIKNPQSLDILLKDIFPRLKTFIFKTVMARVIKKELWGHGIGRHTDAEIWDIGERDLIALSDILGKKPFLMSDSPSEVDCSVFGMLAMIVWQMHGSRHEHFLQNELPNLVTYCERMRDLFWPDWTQRCRGNGYVDDNHKLYTF